MARKFVLGIDFGTHCVRVLAVEARTGRKAASASADYTGGEAGVFLDPRDELVARQHPRDWVRSMTRAINAALKRGQKSGLGFSRENIIGIGVAATGSTPLPLDRAGTPLAFRGEFAGNLNAYAWLWKDHSSWAEAREITEKARVIRPGYLSMYGGTYSPEWFWAKVLRCARIAPRVFNAADTWAEASDYIPALLTKNTAAGQIKRNICAAGHKAMFHRAWAGYPDREFLNKFDNGLVALRNNLPNVAHASNEPAGFLSRQWARKFGLKSGIPVAMGALDAHCAAVGAGVRPGRLVKILDAASSDLTVAPRALRIKSIPGIPGVVEDSVIPGLIGIESGQAAVGEIFDWFLRTAGPGDTDREALSREAGRLKPGQSGLLALDWNNGNRSVLMDTRLSGLILGQSLRTTPAEIYRALIEATAFGARVIIERMTRHRLNVEEVVFAGGITASNDLLLQIYADVLGRPIRLAQDSEAAALGAAIFASVVAGREAGGFATVQEAQARMCRIQPRVFQPKENNRQVYNELYKAFLALHNALGGIDRRAELGWVMKKLLELKKSRLEAPAAVVPERMRAAL